MELDTTFEGHYHLEVGQDIQPSSKVYYYPGASKTGGRDGVVIDVINESGDSWTGIFAFGTFSSNGITSVVHLPDSKSFCVVSQGTAYIVNSNDPTKWEEVDLVPVLDVRLAKEKKLVVLINDTEMCAYGASGLSWRTERLSWHDLKVTNLSDNEIEAEYWNVRDEATAIVKVNLNDGSAIGAAQV